MYAAVGLGLAVLLFGAFLLLGRGSSTPAAAPVIKPLHPVKKRAARPATKAGKKPAKAHAVTARTAKAPLAPPKATKTKKTTKPTDGATDGMPAGLSAALARHAVVVVSLVVPGSSVDDMAYQEAKAGAAQAGAGFVRVSTANNDDVQALSTLVDSNADPSNRLLDAPAVLVFRRPHDLYVRINGYVDADTIAQAAANAAPVAPVQSGRSALASAWVTKVNAACTTLRSTLANESFPTSESQVLPFVRKLVDSVKSTVDRIRGLTPPKGKEQRVSAMIGAYDRMISALYAELDAAQHHQALKIQPLQAQAMRNGTLGDQIAAELGATACSEQSG
jgi:hypothetical protein